MPEHLPRITLVLIIAVLAGCASIPDSGSSVADRDTNGLPVRADMQLDHSLPIVSDSTDKMLSGRVSLSTPDGLIDYGARYEIRQGKLFETIREGKDNLEAAQNEVALQTIEQSLGSTLPLPLGSPLKLALTSREQSKLGLGAQRESQSTGAELQWSPGIVDLQVKWSRAPARSTATRGVDCNLRADLQLPAGFVPGTSASVFELSGQRCHGQAPQHGVTDLELARWGAAWRLGENHNSSLHLVHNEPAVPVESRNVLMPDYELGLSHKHRIAGGWQAQADLAVLRADPVDYSPVAPSRAPATDWSANLALKRNLDLMAVTARWAHATERLWFATAASMAAHDRYSLALDFSAWMASLWPRLQTYMDVSWDWRETREGESDNKVSWNLLIGW